MQTTDLLTSLSLAANCFLGVLGLVLAFFVAKLYGDVAGTKLAIEHEERREATQRRRILEALHAEVASLPIVNETNRIAARNSILTRVLPIPYPATPFGTAIFSVGGITISDETV
jgi:hypothetical protein